MDGASAIRHQARGRSPNNQINKVKRDYVLDLIEENYADFGPTLAAEMLDEHHGFTVSSETLRKWMIERGLWLPRKLRRRFHRSRNRRECFGELIQIDGSDQYQSGKGACGTCQPNVARSVGEGTETEEHIRHGGGQCLPQGI